MHSDQTDQVRDALSSMYGAVAAVVRKDRSGMDLLLADLYESWGDFTGLLATVSFATLDRLDAALAEDRVLPARETRSLAQHLLTEANRFALADNMTVQAAAHRLDAVRRLDHEQMAAEVEHARSVASDTELLRGATALLAATVCEWADRSGRSAHGAASDLCLAMSAAPTR